MQSVMRAGIGASGQVGVPAKTLLWIAWIAVLIVLGWNILAPLYTGDDYADDEGLTPFGASAPILDSGAPGVPCVTLLSGGVRCGDRSYGRDWSTRLLAGLQRAGTRIGQ